MTCRIYTVDRSIPDYVPSTLSGHRDYIVNAWFSADMKDVMTLFFKKNEPVFTFFL